MWEPAPAGEEKIRGVEPAPTLALDFAMTCFVLLGPGLPTQ
jgi:hypothetical protein